MSETKRGPRGETIAVDGIQPPVVGEERFLLRKKKVDGSYVIVREVWTDLGHSSYFDQTIMDWVTWQGSWTHLELIGPFASRDEARAFMTERRRAA